eukprot:TRINITY_DN513_c0_g1_i2.p1 TRINITY_DN513_c0_g1~~TRINITY_DN513_c0_g1_i2.p1  ORF type:complete len:106 (-),score=25.33 TRINITY_DN513_c0_g1_i2:21-338(-)
MDIIKDKVKEKITGKKIVTGNPLDLNHDGRVDMGDARRGAFDYATTGRNPLDTNRDGRLDLQDLDLNRDGHINQKDLMMATKGKREIGRAVQQECRDRSRMPSSA